MSKPVPFSKVEGEEIMSYGNSSCQGCGHATLARIAFKVLGKNTVYTSVPGCIWIALQGSIPLYWRGTVFEGGGALLSGITNGLEITGKDMQVVGFYGDGGTVDIGMGAMSAAAERNENILWICADNEAYMNTGGQRSGATPKYANTTTTPTAKESRGKKTAKKNTPFIVAAHNVPYVATASIAYPNDLIGKLQYAMTLKGFKYIHVQSPCPTGWGFEPSKTIRVARLMVESGVWPLYEIQEGGAFKLNVKPKELKPVREALNQQNRFRHLTDGEYELIQSSTTEKWQQLLENDGKLLPL
jgi:pyruvate/2-oxoacid:ferredoxin oxidoreductase beta subunit